MAALPPYIQFDGRADQTLRHIHRHAAIVVPDMDAIKSRLREHGVEVLFDPKEADPEDDMAANMASYESACCRRIRQTPGSVTRSCQRRCNNPQIAGVNLPT